MLDNTYQYYLRFLLSSLYFSLAASALRIMRFCLYFISLKRYNTNIY